MQIQLRRAFFAAFSFVAILAVASSALAQDAPTLNLKKMGVSFLKDSAPARQATASQPDHEGFGIGVLVGPLFDKTESEDVDVDNAFQGKTGLQFSLFLGGNRPGKFGVATEITLLRRKAENDISINTLQVPFFLRFNFGAENLDGVNVYVKAGPAIDVIFSANQDDESFTDSIERFQVDAIIGVGVEITRFIVEGRYIQGFRAINKEFDENNKIKTKAFALLFGFRFN
jgi:hypothetical protein